MTPTGWRRKLLPPGQMTTLLIAGCGSTLFAALHVPLAWMLGAMAFVTVAALARRRVAVAAPLRNVMLTVLGILVGSAFHADLFSSIVEWRWSIGGLVVFVAAGTAMGSLYLRALLRPDAVTAYFAAAPGGMNEMVLAGEDMGGRPELITLSHSLRIMVVVFSVPFGFTLLTGAGSPIMPARAPGPEAGGAAEYLLLASCALAGPLGQRLRIPAAWMVGPMLVSGAIHVAELTVLAPPSAIVYAAQIVVGASLGIRFMTIDLRTLGRAGLSAVGLAVMLLGLAAACAFGVHAVSGLPVADLFLAYAPGGFTEMSLVAMSVGGDVAFVSAHHILRVFGIAAFAPLVFRILRRHGAANRDG